MATAALMSIQCCTVAFYALRVYAKDAQPSAEFSMGQFEQTTSDLKSYPLALAHAK